MLCESNGIFMIIVVRLCIRVTFTGWSCKTEIVMIGKNSLLLSQRVKSVIKAVREHILKPL